MSAKGGRYLTATEAAFFDKAWRYFRFRNDRAAGRSIAADADRAWRDCVKQRSFKEKAEKLKKERKG